MSRLSSALLVALAVVAGAAGDYTFQTSPASGEFLQTLSGLSVRWEMRQGSSPDSPDVTTPTTLSVSLGYKDASDKPVILFPPIGTNVPASSLQFSWPTMTFQNFANGPPPPRDANTNWFIQLSDQGSGYKSNGQQFHLIEGGAPGTPAVSGVPSATGTTAVPAAPLGPISSTVPSTAPTSTKSAATAGTSSKSPSSTTQASASSTPAGIGTSPVSPSASAATATLGGQSVGTGGVLVLAAVLAGVMAF